MAWVAFQVLNSHVQLTATGTEQSTILEWLRAAPLPTAYSPWPGPGLDRQVSAWSELSAHILKFNSLAVVIFSWAQPSLP